MKRLEEIKKKLQEEGFTLTIHNDYFSEEMLDCFWNNDLGKYATIENDRYRIDVSVCGEVRYHYVELKGYLNNPTIDFISEDPTDLWEYGVNNDKTLYEVIENKDKDTKCFTNIVSKDTKCFESETSKDHSQRWHQYLEIIDNRWIEMPIYDKETGEYITDTFDSCAIIPDTNNILEAIDGGIKEYIEGFLDYDKERE